MMDVSYDMSASTVSDRMSARKILATIVASMMIAVTIVSIGLIQIPNGFKRVSMDITSSSLSKSFSGMSNVLSSIAPVAYADDDKITEDNGEVEGKCEDQANDKDSSDDKRAQDCFTDWRKKESTGDYSKPGVAPVPSNDKFGTDSSSNDTSIDKNWLDIISQTIDWNLSDKTSMGWVDIISMVMQRMGMGYYINGNIEVDGKNKFAWRDEECSDLAAGHRSNTYDNDKKQIKQHAGPVTDKPTIKNTNCDVPSIMTEAIQDLVAAIEPDGIIGADRQSAKTPWNLGYSQSLLPTDDVPVNPDDRSFKYTGLELFGYNLKWAKYRGEWDHIKVMTEARFKVSMTFGQKISTIVQGATDVFTSGGISEDTAKKLNSSNILDKAMGIFQAIKDAFTALIQSGTTFAYRLFTNVLNAAELSATLPSSWYRPEFVGKTMYNARQLTDPEKNAIVKQQLVDAWNAIIKTLTGKDLEFDEASVRQSVEPPAEPKHKVTETTPGHINDEPLETWDEWKQRNADKLKIGTEQLHLDISMYDKLTGSPTQKYKALLTDWTAAIETYVSTQKQDKVDAVAKMVDDKAVAAALDEFNKSLAAQNLYCQKEDGTPEGKASDKAIRSAVDAGVIKEPGKEAYVNGEWQCDGSERPTIVGGLLGSARKNNHQYSESNPDAKSDDPDVNYVDTRRTAYGAVSPIMTLINSRTDAMADDLLGWSQKVILVLNTLIGWSFTPILTELGVKDIMIQWVENLRDTIYMQFVVLVIAIAGLMVMLKVVRGSEIQALQKVATIILTFGFSVMLLFQPTMMFQLVDDVPSALERTLIGTVFASSGQDKLCTATGSPKGTISFSSTTEMLFGKSTFNPDAQVRVMQCKIWEAYVVTPWSYGQWGTNVNQLYATGYTGDGMNGAGQLDVTNDVEKLVGDAEVKMGGSKSTDEAASSNNSNSTDSNANSNAQKASAVDRRKTDDKDKKKLTAGTIHNWAIYQLSLQSSGTISTEDPTANTKVTDKNMYRIIDVQAGPYNGQGRDDSHLDYWTGRIDNHLLVSVEALAASILGLIGLGWLALKKIEVTLMASILLLVAPFLMLYGLIPGNGFHKLKQYGFEILELLLKRITIVVVMAMVIEVEIEISSGGGASSSSASAASAATTSALDWNTVGIGLIVINLMLVVYGRELIDKLLIDIKQQTGNWQRADNYISGAIMGSQLGQVVRGYGSDFVAGIGAGLGGVAAGGFNSNTHSFREMQMRFNGGAAFGTNTFGANWTQQKMDDLASAKKELSIAKSSGNYRKVASLEQKVSSLENSVARGRSVMEAMNDKNVSGPLSNIMHTFDKAQAIRVMSAEMPDNGQIIKPFDQAKQRLTSMARRTYNMRLMAGKNSQFLEVMRQVKEDTERFSSTQQKYAASNAVILGNYGSYEGSAMQEADNDVNSTLLSQATMGIDNEEMQKLQNALGLSNDAHGRQKIQQMISTYRNPEEIRNAMHTAYQTGDYSYLTHQLLSENGVLNVDDDHGIVGAANKALRKDAYGIQENDATFQRAVSLEEDRLWREKATQLVEERFLDSYKGRLASDAELANRAMASSGYNKAVSDNDKAAYVKQYVERNRGAVASNDEIKRQAKSYVMGSQKKDITDYYAKIRDNDSTLLSITQSNFDKETAKFNAMKENFDSLGKNASAEDVAAFKAAEKEYSQITDAYRKRSEQLQSSISKVNPILESGALREEAIENVKNGAATAYELHDTLTAQQNRTDAMKTRDEALKLVWGDDFVRVKSYVDSRAGKQKMAEQLRNANKSHEDSMRRVDMIGQAIDERRKDADEAEKQISILDKRIDDARNSKSYDYGQVAKWEKERTSWQEKKDDATNSINLMEDRRNSVKKTADDNYKAVYDVVTNPYSDLYDKSAISHRLEERENDAIKKFNNGAIDKATYERKIKEIQNARSSWLYADANLQEAEKQMSATVNHLNANATNGKNNEASDKSVNSKGYGHDGRSGTDSDYRYDPESYMKNTVDAFQSKYEQMSQRLSSARISQSDRTRLTNALNQAHRLVNAASSYDQMNNAFSIYSAMVNEVMSGQDSNGRNGNRG